MITEEDLVQLGFEKKLMIGTGYTSISSMRPAIYYYTKNNITINATKIWNWFLNGELRNDIAVDNIEDLKKLINNGRS